MSDSNAHGSKFATAPLSGSPRAAEAAAPPGRAFGRTFWLLNTIEMFERLAYFGIRAVVPLYIMQATEPGGLHLTAIHKGWIYMWWAIFQSFLPIVTGGIADRYGYKRVLFFAISANAVGYVMMANLHSYYGFFAGVLVLATGTAFFKPSLQGSLAQNLTKANSSLGWGIFYWVVNVGAFAAPFISTLVLGKPHSLEGWQNLFYLCAAFTCVNLLLLFTFKDVPSGADKTESPLAVLKRTIVNIFDPRLITWLLIMSCFWLMMYQLWDLHPNFITDWVDSSEVAAHLPFDALREWGDRGKMQVPQQILLNLNAGLIILLMVPLSWLSGKMRTLSAMLVGMGVATLGVLVAGWTMSGWVFLAGVVFFSLGEMWTGPKKNEYLGLIAPPGKKGLYLGYVNIPVGIGVGIGSYFGGWLYDNYGEKATLALKELASQPALIARAAQSADWSDALDKLPKLLAVDRDAALGAAQVELGQDADAAAETLRKIFRHDAGQVTNLALLYLAQHDRFKPQVEAARSAAVAAGKIPKEAGLAACVAALPDWLGLKRVVAFDLVRELLRTEDEALASAGDSAIADFLWKRFGDEREVINNLALEYLAQGTGRLRQAVAELGGDTPPRQLKDRLRQLEDRLGLGRTKSFEALTAALGADDAAIEEARVREGAADDYCYLAGLDHRRFIAVAKRDWTKDVPLLREMIESDAGAKAIFEQRVWQKSLTERLLAVFREPAEQDLYERLAENQSLIQQALAEKDWSNAGEQAARLFRMNPFEARALAAAEVNHAAQRATLMLWEKYHPNRRVWLPIVAIGVIAAIALGVFGRMAKRWNDMNA